MTVKRVVLALLAALPLLFLMTPLASYAWPAAHRFVRLLGGQSEAARPLTLPFEVQYRPHPVIPSGLSCAEATDAERAFATYERVREALTSNREPRSIEYLDCFLGAEDILGPAPAVLGRFIGTAFDSDVLYAYLSNEFERVLIDSAKGGSLDHWESSHLGACALLAFDNTSESRFVELYINHFRRLLQMRDSVLMLRDDFHDRVMDSWGDTNLGENSGDPTRWVAHVTHFSVVMIPATAFAARIRQHPSLDALREDADRIVDYFRSAYRQFDVDQRPAEGTSEIWFWRPLANIFEATNHLHLQGQALLNMYTITGDELYAERLRSIVRIFERGVTIDDRGFVAWNYYPYFQIKSAMDDTHGRLFGELIWKASLTIPFLYQAATTQFAVAPTILAATTRTIHDHVLANNDYATHLNPRQSGPMSKRTTGLDRDAEASITGFLAASAEKPAIAEQVRTIVTTRRDLYPNGWFRSPRLARGYAFFTGRAIAH